MHCVLLQVAMQKKLLLLFFQTRRNTHFRLVVPGDNNWSAHKLLAHSNKFGRVVSVIRDEFSEARIYYEDVTMAFKAMHEHELREGDRFGVIIRSDTLEEEGVNPYDVSP